MAGALKNGLFDAENAYDATKDRYRSYKCEIYFKDGSEPRKLVIVAKSKYMANAMLWRFLYLKNRLNDISHTKIVRLRATKSNIRTFAYQHTDSFMERQLEALRMEYADEDETMLKAEGAGSGDGA